MNELVERQIEKALQDVVNDKAVQIAKVIDKFAEKQGGKSAIENYQLLGKRTLIVVGATLVTVETISLISQKIISRKLEKRRTEATVRRILAEEGLIEN